MPFEELVAQIVQAPHQLYFSEQFDNFIFHGSLTFHYLQSRHASSSPALRLRHASIRAVADQLQHLIFLIDGSAQFMRDSKFILG